MRIYRMLFITVYPILFLVKITRLKFM